MQDPVDLVSQARRFAGEAHRNVGQLRKYSAQPYEEHLRSVAEMVSAVTDDPEIIAAAWLHDVVEDTPTTIEDIQRAFGPGVRELVDALTDVSRPHDGNRAARKALDRAHLAAAPARAQTVKLADLIDNCQDICRHNAKFGRVYLAEMAALLEVLTAGDESLRRKAKKTHDTWSARLARASLPPPAETFAAAAGSPGTRMRRALHAFAHGFRAGDVAEPLPSFEAESPVATALDIPDCPVFGVRERGRIAAYVPRAELGTGCFAETMRPILPSQVLDSRSGLANLVMTLTRHDYCFVNLKDEVGAYAGRDEMQSPVARMWLFGMITTTELAISQQIRSAAADREWMSLLTPARLQKARVLQQSRAKMGRPVPLLDCLQLSDKIRILLDIDDGPAPLMRGQSRAESQRLARDLEDLRNSLAHAQDIVTHDWVQIARLAGRLEELAAGEGGAQGA
ncbi:MAG: bifunctional (p)ppGpp synthetase/guanosine-3',5'-bis(diphosphate) 3'-pyrophosphohydrolase [Burkholderiales bacterium]|nr:bifunctional (p)ppGpp synthetase/guanosine-3',5'-bis(diphosphate) 3'-pyrophosphohydrolase [Burkholderiales bacterium]